MHPETLIIALNTHGVKYIIVGGFAAILQGARYVTQDIDFCYARDEENLARLLEALQPFRPVIRPNPDIPFDLNTLREHANFTLTTTVGELDLLASIDGLGDYAEVAKHADIFTMRGQAYQVLTLKALIEAKQVLGRRKDKQLLEELQSLAVLRVEKENPPVIKLPHAR